MHGVYLKRCVRQAVMLQVQPLLLTNYYTLQH
jgi:hypothetical protein